jgi:hypothetical protein
MSGLNVAYRVVGKVTDGHCLLRLPDDLPGARWLIRTETADDAAFRLFETDGAGMKGG